MLKQLQDKVKEFSRVLDMFPEVRYVGDPVLRCIVQEVSLESGLVVGQRLGEVLLRYRNEVGYGRGFAAPQIGESKAVFVTFVDDELQTFINPRIIETSSETTYYRELCLSSGIMSADVKRPEWIVLEWVSSQGIQQRERFDGFLARLYQHEEAHLRGRLNLDEAIEGGIEFALFDPLKEKLRSKS